MTLSELKRTIIQAAGDGNQVDDAVEALMADPFTIELLARVVAQHPDTLERDFVDALGDARSSY